MPASDFGSVPMVLVVLVMLITGARRVRHVGYVEGDPLVERICGLGRMPTQHTLGRWLQAFDDRSVKALRSVNERLVGEIIDRSELRRLTLDVDGSVVSTGLKAEGARRGFNPHRRKVPSYYPITAYEANTGQLLRVQNRPGNVHDGKVVGRFSRGALCAARGDARTPACFRSLFLRKSGPLPSRDMCDAFRPAENPAVISITATICDSR